MIVRLKEQVIVITGEGDAEQAEVAAFGKRMDDVVFALRAQDGQTFRLTKLGPRVEACREPINIISKVADAALRLLSNLAHTPFELHGRRYESVEGFWQGLKWPDVAERARIAALWGQAARHAGDEAPASPSFEYEGDTIYFGTHEHRQLMFEANRAKFQQHAEARAALLATAPRPLTHRVQRDSKTIPGVLMAEMWMKIREGLLASGE